MIQGVTVNKCETANKYEFEEFEDRATAQVRRMVFLQVDIAKHSEMSERFAADQVMEAKLEFANRLEDLLRPLGFRGVFWAGDGGMFAMPADDAMQFSHAVVDAWRRIEDAVESVNARFQKQSFDGKRIEIRASAHLGDVNVHRHPRYWHSTAINFFAKYERKIGQNGTFRITGTLRNGLTDSIRKLFVEKDKLPSPKDLPPECDGCGDAASLVVYELRDACGGMRSITDVLDSIEEWSQRFRKYHREKDKSKGDKTKNDPPNSITESKDTLSVFVESEKTRDEKPCKDFLIIVAIQKDFCEGGRLAVKGMDSLVGSVNVLINAAIEKQISFVFARDWHPKDHPSFNGPNGDWNAHCIRDDSGADWHRDLNLNIAPCLIVDIGSDNGRRDYTPFNYVEEKYNYKEMPPDERKCVDEKAFGVQTDRLKDLLENCNRKESRVYVAGVALDYCIAATCLDALAFVDNVYALEEYIRPAGNNHSVIEDIWYRLRRAGVERVRNFSLERWTAVG